MNAVTAAIINNTYAELSIFIVLSNWLDDIAYEQEVNKSGINSV
jgi:hypothetical protein